VVRSAIAVEFRIADRASVIALTSALGLLRGGQAVFSDQAS
jgi:hypothetical protein